MTADREPQTRDYLRANLFDGSEDGTVVKISTWLDELTEVVDTMLAEARAEADRLRQQNHDAAAARDKETAALRSEVDRFENAAARACELVRGSPVDWTDDPPSQKPNGWWNYTSQNNRNVIIAAVRAAREAQPDPRVEALETLLRDLRFGLDRLGYGEEVARIDAALAAPAPPSEAEARLRDAAAVSYSFADRQDAPPDEWRAYERGEGVLFTPTMTADREPQTETGRRTLADWDDDPATKSALRVAILAIEAEARRDGFETGLRAQHEAEAEALRAWATPIIARIDPIEAEARAGNVIDAAQAVVDEYRWPSTGDDFRVAMDRLRAALEGPTDDR